MTAMKNIIMILKTELYKLICQRYFFILIIGFILFLAGLGWVRLKVAGYTDTQLSGFQLAAFLVSTGSNLLVLIMIILSGSAIASERSQGNLDLICVRSVPRGQIISGKLLYLFSVALMLLILLFVISLATGAGLAGLQSLAEGEYTIYHFSQLLGHYATGFCFSVLPVFAWCSIAFFFSILITSPVWANASSLILFFAFYLLLPFDEIINFTPNRFLNVAMEMMSKITYGLPALWEHLYRLSFYSLIYVSVFSFLSILVFRRQDIL